MPSLRFAAAIIAAVVLHSVGARLWGDFPSAVDLFLVVVVMRALGSSVLTGLLGGLAAGLVADSFTGSLYGLNGFADTILGYSTAYAAHRFVIQRATSVFVLFSLAAALQRGILIGLALVIAPESSIPSFFWSLVAVGTTGLLGTVLWASSRRLSGRWRIWKSFRSSRLQ